MINKILLFGSSTGGPKALVSIFQQLPKVNCPIVIIQHMPPDFTISLAQSLSKIAKNKVVHTSKTTELENGKIYVVPSPYQMKIILNEGQYLLFFTKSKILSSSTSEIVFNPSIDNSSEKLIELFKSKVIGVFLSGLSVGQDGVIAAKQIKSFSGKTIGQSKKTSICFGLVENINKEGYIDEIVDLDKIPERITELVN